MAHGIEQELADLDFATVSPQEFAQIVKRLSTRQINELSADTELRERVITEIRGRIEKQFRPDKAGDLDAVIRWNIGNDDNRRVFETHIANGTVTVTEGRSDARPRVTLTLGDAEFLQLVSGNASPFTLFMTRKLKVFGDVGLASGLTKIFDIPRA
ncbi:SCP2 sterol-binding domain-containing protein [Streptomyces sp. B1866]|uniref:SCP2 sterol-binding domain-containing protein n=1 Tax=Streptomyces sp. B1866 TaxID=3075431 RepID=UPI002890F354|nr:SCP2 sterol-binding domain-containing protein [Streptomyces sp. B1866]MDT3398236.1 SCP2 sterol-binding domain-containing protein [Streptomyces sp. B1866]